MDLLRALAHCLPLKSDNRTQTPSGLAVPPAISCCHSSLPPRDPFKVAHQLASFSPSLQKSGDIVNEVINTTCSRRIRCKNLEVFKVVFQKSRFQSEKSGGRSRAFGRSAVSWPSGLVHDIFDGRGGLDSLGRRIGHSNSSG